MEPTTVRTMNAINLSDIQYIKSTNSCNKYILVSILFAIAYRAYEMYIYEVDGVWCAACQTMEGDGTLVAPPKEYIEDIRLSLISLSKKVVGIESMEDLSGNSLFILDQNIFYVHYYLKHNTMSIRLFCHEGIDVAARKLLEDYRGEGVLGD
jgi:hypothetical protein